jgi:hypothetical protein
LKHHQRHHHPVWHRMSLAWSLCSLSCQIPQVDGIGNYLKTRNTVYKLIKLFDNPGNSVSVLNNRI